MREQGGSASGAIEMLPPSATRSLRIAFGVLFLWLGLLKVVPGMSPAEDLMRASMPSFVPIDAFIRFAAVWEIVIGVGFLTGTLKRLVVLMTFATMGVTLSILWLAPGRLWDSFPFGLSFDGVYVVKDLVITASAIVLAVATVQEQPGIGRVGEAVRRRWPAVVERYLAFEVRATNAIAPWSIPLLRAALGIVFIWFGLLNLVDPTHSPTWFMVQAAMPDAPGEVVFRIWGAVGVFAGIGIVTGRFDRLAVVLLVAMMVASAAWFLLAPDLMFQQPPFVLTLEGQHVVKNLILAAAGIAVLQARPTRAVEPDPASEPAPEPVAGSEGAADLAG